MLSREEVKEIALMQGDGAYFVSLYLDVNPVTNPGGEYAIWLKNSLRSMADSLGKEALRKVEKDLSAVEGYVMSNRRDFKRGLVLFCSGQRGFWRQYNLNVPLGNELVVEKTPYIKPLLIAFERRRRYAVLLVEKDEARIFVVELGEITEYGEHRTEGVPGKHKKGGWFALSQTHFARHVDHHVTLHLKDVLDRFGSFLSDEGLKMLILGGPEEAVSMTRGLLPREVSEKVIGAFRAGMFEDSPSVLKKVEPVLEGFERQQEASAVAELFVRAMKNEKAVLGIENVLAALNEGRVMRLFFLRDLRLGGHECSACGALGVSEGKSCALCGGALREAPHLVDSMAQRAIEQSAEVEVVSSNEGFRKAGGAGAILRF